jgi:hypothetical protein
LVLKYWLIDEAAIGSEEGPCSTNGAVDSSGVCHSTRVKLETLPMRKRKDIDGSPFSEQIATKRPKIFTEERNFSFPEDAAERAD